MGRRSVEFGDVFEVDDKELMAIEMSRTGWWIGFIIHIKGTCLFEYNQYSRDDCDNFKYKGRAKYLPTEWFEVLDESKV